MEAAHENVDGAHLHHRLTFGQANRRHLRSPARRNRSIGHRCGHRQPQSSRAPRRVRDEPVPIQRRPRRMFLPRPASEGGASVSLSEAAGS
jgi:hypothetical protein